MSNQVDVKFRLKQRKAKGSQSGNLTTENVLITMRVTYLSMRLVGSAIGTCHRA